MLSEPTLAAAAPLALLPPDNPFAGRVGARPEIALYFSTSNRDGRGKPAAGDDRILRLVPQKP